MDDYSLNLAQPDMDVCDQDGLKIGTVGRVHRATLAPAEGLGDPSRILVLQEGVVEVRTGPFGLGRHLYVPAHAVVHVTGNCVFLSVSRDALPGLGWHVKPELLDRRN